MTRAIWFSLMLSAVAGLASTISADAHVDLASGSQPELQLASKADGIARIKTVLDEPTRNMTPEQRDELRRKMRERWDRLGPQERREMEQRLREYQAYRFCTPTS